MTAKLGTQCLRWQIYCGVHKNQIRQFALRFEVRIFYINFTFGIHNSAVRVCKLYRKISPKFGKNRQNYHLLLTIRGGVYSINEENFVPLPFIKDFCCHINIGTMSSENNLRRKANEEENFGWYSLCEYDAVNVSDRCICCDRSHPSLG